MIVFVFVFVFVFCTLLSALRTVSRVLSSLAFVRTFGSTDTQHTYKPTLTVMSTTFSYSGCNLFHFAFFLFFLLLSDFHFELF